MSYSPILKKSKLNNVYFCYRDSRLGASTISAALNARAANVNGSPQLIAPSVYNNSVSSCFIFRVFLL